MKLVGGDTFASKDDPGVDLNGNMKYIYIYTSRFRNQDYRKFGVLKCIVIPCHPPFYVSFYIDIDASLYF